MEKLKQTNDFLFIFNYQNSNKSANTVQIILTFIQYENLEAIKMIKNEYIKKA